MGVSEDGPPKEQHVNMENDDTPWNWEPPFFRQTKKHYIPMLRGKHQSYPICLIP